MGLSIAVVAAIVEDEDAVVREEVVGGVVVGAVVEGVVEGSSPGSGSTKQLKGETTVLVVGGDWLIM